MLLYHGTTHDFTQINVQKGKPFKDFGRGFYATADRNHAIALANRNYKIECLRLHEQQQASIAKWLYSYELSAIYLESLSVKEFKCADREWIRFVTANRSSKKPIHSYDIVIGPTANDQTSSVIQIYFSGGYGEVGSDDALDMLTRMIIPDKLPRQYFFATQRLADQLKFIEKVSIT